jgi:hypothetical protein
MIDIRLPNINGKTEAQQLSQIKSYLYQFAGQLQWALSAVEAGGSPSYLMQKAGPGGATKEDTAASNFAELKALIINSADIVEEYYERIDALLKLSGEYTAYSEFGVFREETLNQLSANNSKIEQNVKSLQQIFDTEGNIRAELLVNGHIYSGIIEYAKDGEAIVGIEIGQTTVEDGVETFNKFARFTADRLAFYDATYQDEPVAYISNYMLVITNAWVKGNLELGINNHFVLDTSNGLALRPV